MALQPYTDPGQALALYQAEQITPEEQERRTKEVRTFYAAIPIFLIKITARHRHRPCDLAFLPTNLIKYSLHCYQILKYICRLKN
jgi:hypothetical protein